VPFYVKLGVPPQDKMAADHATLMYGRAVPRRVCVTVCACPLRAVTSV
jgi:hypothetical protein